MTDFTKIFVDSSVFIEYFKGKPKAVELAESLFSRPDFKLFVNDVVYSEIAYIFIRTKAGKSHLSLKKDKSLVIDVGKDFLKSIFPLFEMTEFLKITKGVITLANKFIVDYGLLPNDALILATCKLYDIDCLASLDVEDFKEPCEKEGILLVSGKRDIECF